MTTKTLTAAPDAKRWAALALLCVAQFMVIMDTSIIGVALPAIKQSLGYTDSGLQWIFNAYVIFFGGLLLLGGKMADLFGPRKVFLWGFGILTASSLLAGLAWNEYSMNIGRALQGMGSALIAPAALTLIMNTFTDQKELNKALGLWGASAAAGGSAGVFLGGVLTEYLSWNWVFLINIPIGLLVMSLSPSRLLKGNIQKGKLDIFGAFVLTVSMVILVYTIVSGEYAGWFSAITLLSFTLSIALFVLFVFHQKRTSHPLMHLSIFKAPNLAAGNLVMMLMAGAWIPLWFFLNLYLQQILNLSAFYSGLALLPLTLVIMLLMVGFIGKLVAKFGFKKNLVVGLILLFTSLILFAQLPIDGTFSSAVLLPSLIAAVGMSLAYVPGTIASMSGAKPHEMGLASGLVNSVYQVGSAIGLAVAVAISNSTINTAAGSGSINKLAINSGFHAAFYVAAAIMFIGILIAIFRVKSQPSQ